MPDNMTRTRQDFYVATDAGSHFPFAFSPNSATVIRPIRLSG